MVHPQTDRDVTTVRPTAAPKSLMILCNREPEEARLAKYWENIFYYFMSYSTVRKKMNKYISEFKNFSP